MDAKADPIRLLYFVKEAFPTHRVDVTVLFGRELAQRGYVIDYVMQAAEPGRGRGARAWGDSGHVLLGATVRGQGALARIARELLDTVHDCAVLLARARRRHYDAIQVRDKVIVASLAVLLARWRRLPLYFWLSYPLVETDLLNATAGVVRYPRITRLRGLLASRLLYRWILPRSSHVFAQSALMRLRLCERGIAPQAITAVPMGVDADEALQIAARPNLPRPSASGGRVLLGYLGVLDANRRLDILIDMLAILRRHDDQVGLLLIGDAVDARDVGALRARARSLGLEAQVEFTGRLPRAQALARLCEATVALSPIYRSPIFDVGSPTKLIEYLALALPVVANDQPDQRAVLQACRAGVCVPWGARHFARGVRWLLRLPAPQRRRMAEAGREWTLTHRSYATIAAQVDRQYRALLGRCR